jgi:hypothetical protein
MPKFLAGLTTFFISISISHSAHAENLTSPSGDLVFNIFPNAPYKVPEAGLKLENELTFTTSKYAVGNIQVDLVGPGDGFYQEVIFKVDGPGGYYVETPNTFWPITIPWAKLKEGTHDYKVTFSFSPKWQQNYIEDACVKKISPNQPVEIPLEGEAAVFWEAECARAVKAWTGNTTVRITKLPKTVTPSPTPIIINQTNTYIVINNIFVTKNRPVKAVELAKTLKISKNSKDKYKVTLLSNSMKNCGISNSSVVAKKKGKCKGEIKVTYSNGKTKTQRFQLQVKI